MITNGAVELPSHQAGRFPWVAAHILLDTQVPGAPSYENPLFYHPSMQYFAPLVDPGTDYAYLRLNTMRSGLETSAPFKADDWNVIWSGDDTEVFWEYADLNGWAQFFTSYDLKSLDVGALHWHNGQVLTGPNAPLNHFSINK